MWNGFIVDGHHRYKICTKHNLPFKTEEGKFEDEDDALIFIINNQMKKRNLNDFEKASYLIVLKKILARKDSKERQGTRTDITTEGNIDQHAGRSQQNDKMSGRVDRILAKEAGVSHDTVSKVSKILDHATEETKQKLKKGKLSVRKAYTDIKREEVAQESNFPKGQYRIIHADPYLRDNTLPCGWNMKSLQFNPGNLPVKDNLDPDDAVLFLWTPQIRDMQQA